MPVVSPFIDSTLVETNPGLPLPAPPPMIFTRYHFMLVNTIYSVTPRVTSTLLVAGIPSSNSVVSTRLTSQPLLVAGG